jgi:hypothetical protein
LTTAPPREQIARVFVRVSKFFVVLALVMVIGGHWALLQSVAWVGMAVNFSKKDSFTTALQKTFDGKHPCPLCKLVKAGKASEKKQDLQKLEAKIDLQLVAGSCGLFPPRPIRHFSPVSECAASSGTAPLLPPPRAT